MQKDNLIPLTPNMLILGCNSTLMSHPLLITQMMIDSGLRMILQQNLKVESGKERETNILVGDAVFMWYAGNIKNDYRIARVTEVYPDASGLVQTVTLAYRVKNKRAYRRSSSKGPQ